MRPIARRQTNLESLTERLRHPDPLVRSRAVDGLVRLRPARLVPLLCGMLSDADHFVRGAAVQALGTLGEPSAVPALCRALEDPAWDVRMRAADALGALGDPEGASALCGVLLDPDPLVHVSAERALARLLPLDIVEPLILLVRNAGPAERQVAAGLLSAWAREGGDVAALRDVLRAFNGREPAASPAASASAAVSRCASLIERGSAGVQGNVILLLARLGDRRAVPLLTRLLRDDWWKSRLEAARALGELRDPSAVPALCRALRDRDSEVRRTAAEALGRIGSPEAIDSLDFVVSQTPTETLLATTAAEALGRIGHHRAVPCLCVALGDERPVLRAAAARALAAIAEKDPSPELRRALPELRRRLKVRLIEPAAVRTACYLAIQRIEGATGAATLPVPASCPEPAAETLPLPGAAPETDPPEE